MTRSLVTAVAPRWESQVATLLTGSGQARLVRRCADVAELVGACRAGLAQVALVSWDVRGLDRQVVQGLVAAGARVVGLHPDHDEDAARLLRRWGVSATLGLDSSTSDLDDALQQLFVPGDEADLARDVVEARVLSDGVDPGAYDARAPSAGPGDVRDTHDEQETGAREPGQGSTPPAPPGEGGDEGEVIVVWGPHGSTGRTTVAVNLAHELADPTQRVVLVDADTCGGSVAQALAVLDESPGVAAAARAADQGTLDEETLLRLAPQVRPGLLVLTGLPRADRWTELREAALADVIQQARALARWVVVDVASSVEQDEELSFDTDAPRRNGATLCALQEADRVLVVGSGDPVGLQRLVRALDQLPGLSAGAPEVVVTRVRPGPVGPEPGRRIVETLRRFARADRIHLVPEDRETLDAALLHGHTLAETRPGSPAQQALVTLAAHLGGRPARSPGRRRWGARLPLGTR
ncbi:AAA family ATPase [Serinicoccus kebangsaanensis]|uniref:AAA family ATPase n=1 Tax=Serinicoccus kebangsaanensis TaxID=2602069 RepID=UPI00124E471F|nr:P-loop NTPase [Serinicoccus kebangsaanensis]